MDSSSSPSTPTRNWEHHVFVSFRGEDVRTTFLSHLLKELRSKAIDPFMDNKMPRGASITPELIRAIKGSRIAIVLLSQNYASSSWCLHELVKIIECRKKIGQKVITIFYQVQPTDVKKQAGDFGKVFKKTCKDKTSKVIRKWREALAEVATIAGYDSSNWGNEAAAIEKISTDISEMLNHLAPSYYLDRFIGIKAHIKKMLSLLRLDLEDEVRMIGICGLFGIGKSTICRSLYNQYSNNFPFNTIMVNIKQNYPNPCLDEGSAQLQLQNDMLSKMINHKDIVITHLGAAKDRLKDKKVFLVLDDVDRLAQLKALAGDISWFGPGSRIIIATEDLRVLRAHGIAINHIYKVKYPPNDEAFQIFCMYAFPQKSPEDDFTELAQKITYLVGNLPLGLQVLGSCFLRRSKNEWIELLSKLRRLFDGSIESIFKFNNDVLSEETCGFNSASSSPRQSQNWEHDVFVSFLLEDVRTSSISHILKEFKRKKINPFIDNEIKKGASITPELKRAIKGSRIAIVLLSKNYASSSWCLDELVKIIKCRKKWGQKVITIFYQVEPYDVKKQIGDFGMVYKETCKNKTDEVTQKWKEALVEVATIAGYDSRNWVDEAAAIKEIISDMLNHLTASQYLDRLIGMDTHMEKMQSLLRLDLEDEVRMIGIWGPPGIGKSTICRYLYDHLSNNFQMTAIMVNIKQNYPNMYLDELSAQLQLQNDMLSKMFNNKDIKITHLGAAKDMLKYKKVLLVLDDVDQHAQLVALAKDNWWFGPGSRIIIAIEDLTVLFAHGIGIHRTYKVNYPSHQEALEMFCMYAFRRKFPDDSFVEFAHEVIYLVGKLPLGLQVIGSHFSLDPKKECTKTLIKFKSRLDEKIESILKLRYDALDEELKYVFLRIACDFNWHQHDEVEASLANCLKYVRKRLLVLAEKALIYYDCEYIIMHKLVAQLGQEIVRKRREIRSDCDYWTIACWPEIGETCRT